MLLGQTLEQGAHSPTIDQDLRNKRPWEGLYLGHLLADDPTPPAPQARLLLTEGLDTILMDH